MKNNERVIKRNYENNIVTVVEEEVICISLKNPFYCCEMGLLNLGRQADGLVQDVEACQLSNFIHM